MLVESSNHVCRCLCLVVLLLSGAAGAATFSVTNTDDSGPGSLRQAILDANATSGDDTIDVALSAGSVISPLSALPEIDPATPTDATTVTASARVALSGANAGGTVSGLVLRGDKCTVRGLAVVNWGGYGIEIYGDNYRIANCLIGNNGTNAFPNALGGVLVASVEDGVIGRFDGSGTGNIISGNGGPGIRVESATGSGLVIAGNAIGSNATGTAALPNAGEGILLQGGNVQIGGAAPAERNLISGNSGSGVQINGGANIVLRNNIIGMNLPGTAALPNALSGISVANPVTGIIIGGQIAGRGNYISGNGQYGILTGGTGVFIYGNVIGLDLTKTNPVPNGLSGVQAADGECTIGGTTAGAANTISGNISHGVSESGGDGALVVIRGNAIFANGSSGLFMNSGAATATSTPIATCLSPLAGTSVANATVDVFVDDEDEGALYLDTVTADSAGVWTSAVDLSASIGRNLTLTATKPAGSTSPFSTPVEISSSFAPCESEGEGEGTPDGEGEGAIEGEGEGAPEGEGEVNCGYGDDDSGSFGSCTLGSRFGQRPAPNGDASSGFYGSDDGLNRYQSDNFINVEGTIAGIRWWGAGVLFGSPCMRTPNRFRIEIYSGTNLGTRTFVSAQEVTATITATEGQSFLSPVYQFEAALATPLAVQNGWLSIVGIDDEDCYFYWYRSDAGDGIRGDQIGTDAPSANSGDFAFCLLPCAPEGGVEGETEGEGEGQVDGEEPLDCPTGYAPNAGGTACEPCAPGKYSIDGIECLDCPLGQFSPNFGSISCFPCSLGRVPNAEQTACVSCVPGTYSPDSLACLDCPEGTISALAGATLCTDCPNGTEPNAGRTACDDCPPGAYSPDGIECLDCPDGSVSAGDGAASCVTCPPGTEANEARTACVPVTSEGEVDGEGGFDCPAGFSSDGDSCVPCAAGTYSPDGVACLDCPAGLVSGTGATFCTACAPGTAPNVSQTACEPCTAGSFSADGVACLDCPAGSVSGFNGASACETCSEGTAPNAAQTICIELTAEGEGEGNVAVGACPADSLFSMPPLTADVPDAGFYRSDEPSGDLRFERFEGVGAPILAVRWWGTNTLSGPCSRARENWEIRFYEGDSLSLGNLVSSQRVTATRRSTGAVVLNLGVDEFEADLPIPVSLENGWISIVGLDDAACSFFWYRSSDGNDGHLRVINDEPTSGVGSDLAFCLSPVVLVDVTAPIHSTDQNADNVINLSELLRLVQFYNSSRFGCADDTEDRYAPGATDETCRFHAADYDPQDWRFTLSELLRVIQFYNVGGYLACPEEESEDGYCVSAP